MICWCLLHQARELVKYTFTQWSFYVFIQCFMRKKALLWVLPTALTLNNSTILTFSLEFDLTIESLDICQFFIEKVLSLTCLIFYNYCGLQQEKTENIVSLINNFLATNIIHHSNLFTWLQLISSMHLWVLCLATISVEMTTPTFSLDSF